MEEDNSIDNEFGVEYIDIGVRRLRIFRISDQWLVEYQRVPRPWAPWDYFWWYNDGRYVEYKSAIKRVNEIKEAGVVKIARFQKMKVFEVDNA